MGGVQSELAVEFSQEQVDRWRREVAVKRNKLFRENWKNRRHVPGLKSKGQVETFQFILEWYDEFGDVVGRDKERVRLDELISQGKDVNAPENRPKK